MIPHGTCAVRTAVLDNGEDIFVRVDGNGESESGVAFKIKMFGNQVAISKLAQLSPLWINTLHIGCGYFHRRKGIQKVSPCPLGSNRESIYIKSDIPDNILFTIVAGDTPERFVWINGYPIDICRMCYLRTALGTAIILVWMLFLRIEVVVWTWSSFSSVIVGRRASCQEHKIRTEEKSNQPPEKPCFHMKSSFVGLCTAQAVYIIYIYIVNRLLSKWKG